ncbi:MAG: DUF6969 family protein [Alphaproteobacteria bacterium]
MMDFNALGTERLEAMADAGLEVIECHRVLAKTGDNIVSEVLPREGTFYELEHFPINRGHILQQRSSFGILLA